MKKQRTLVVGVPPGIGDSLWAMLPLQEIMRQDGADGLIVCLQAGKPARGKEFIERLDFVTQARYEEFPALTHGEFHVLPDGTYNYAGGPGGAVRNYLGMDWWLCPNRVLERGEHLRTWLGEFEHDWRIMLDHFRFDPADDIVADQVSERLRGKQWVTFFLAGLEANGGFDQETGEYHVHGGYNRARRYTRQQWDGLHYLPDRFRRELRPLWTVEDWVELGLVHIVERDDCGIVIVGANWREDIAYAAMVEQAWGQSGGDPARLVNLCGQTHIAEALRMVQRGRGLVSYPSGIAIASTYLNVPTVMFYRAFGDPQNEANGRDVSFSENMATAWHPTWARYAPEFFGRCSPESVYERLRTIRT